MTLVVLTLSMVVQWPVCIGTNVELHLLLDSFKFVDAYYFVCYVAIIIFYHCCLMLSILLGKVHMV